MTTTKKLWLGFGVLTALLVVTVSVIFIYVRALRGQVAEMATSREIGMTSREIETHVLGYALDVRRYLQTGEPDMGVGLERAAAKVDGSIAEYQRLATTAPRRAMAGQLVEHWRDLLRRGRALMQVGSRASTQQLTEFGEARSRLEGFLESEVQADAERDYETRREATRRDARNAVVVSLVLLVVGVLIGVVTSAVVGKGIIAGEGELRASEAFSRSVIESSPDCVKVLDTAGRLLRMNANGMAIMEIDDFTPLAGRPWVELWPEEKRGQVLAALDTTRAGGIGRFRSACPTARGTLKSWDVVVAPIRDADGRIASLVAVSRDVTEQERAAARERVLLAEAAGASAKFRAFFEQGALFAGIMDLDGTILEPNRVALEACGYTREQVVGKPFWDCPWWTPSAALVDQIKVAYACALGGETYRAEMPYYVADGSERMVDLIILPITDATGQILFLAPTGTDITERHRLENELRRLAADLSEADHRKNEFLAVLAHELRNPLTPIRNAVQILRLRGGDDPTIRATCEMMARQVGHMVRLVEDLLDVSRISRGKIELRRSTVELAPVLEHALEAVRPLCEEMGHELTVSVPQEPIRLDGDPVRLAQVVGNLLSNAAKFTPRGGHVWLTVERAGEQAIIRVRDQGIGIAPEQLPHIFEMFTQVDSALERSQAGLGIGLTLVKQLVELHGGTVDVHSAGLGTGTEFVVRLPVAAAPASPATQVRAAPAGATTPAVCRILVVDDNRDAVESLGLLLECDGHEVHAAYDGVEAVAAAAKLEPDLVLLDIGLPNLNGYEAARRIREQPRTRRMVLVALTGWGQDDDRRRSAEAGFDAHLVKPIDYRALSELVARVTELRSAG